MSKNLFRYLNGVFNLFKSLGFGNPHPQTHPLWPHLLSALYITAYSETQACFFSLLSLLEAFFYF